MGKVVKNQDVLDKLKKFLDENIQRINIKGFQKAIDEYSSDDKKIK
ncbi:hypothetical protein ACQKMI_10780 [Lysinibacillus sp. NPDC097214]